jgi:hypothetical protein
MSSSPSNARQSMPAFFSLKTGTDQYIVKDTASDGFQVGAEYDGALLFQMPSVSETSDGLVLLQTFGGRRQVPADPSRGVVLRDSSAAQAPFFKVPVGDGFALGIPDKEHWLSVSDEGKLVFSKLTSPGVSETFTTQATPHAQKHACCGPSSSGPSKALWDDVGHRTIVEQAILCLRNPWSPTAESREFIRIWDSNTGHQSDLFKGLREADYDDTLDDKWGGITYYTSHFYDPDTGNNYWGDYHWGNPGPTALQRGSEYFQASVETYLSKNLTAESTFEQLGIALHYLTDLTQPMHAANIPNIYGDHEDWPRLDWRHTRYEGCSELMAKSGKWFTDYPRLTAEEMSIQGISSIGDLYKEIAKASKRVWLDYVKPIYEKKGYNEAWGQEAWEALQKSTHMAPVGVAKFLSYWTHSVMKGS